MEFNLPPEYEGKAQELISNILNCIDDEAWTCVKTLPKENITIYTKPSTEFSGKMFKGIGLIEASPEDCFKAWYPKPQHSRSKWDKSIKAFEMVKPIRMNEFPEVYLLRTMTPSACMGLISARDFVDLNINVHDETMVGTFAQSIEQDICPPSNDYVRAVNHYCAMLNMRIPSEPNKTNLIFIGHPDIGGQIPTKLVESAVPSTIVDFYRGLKGELKLR